MGALAGNPAAAGDPAAFAGTSDEVSTSSTETVPGGRHGGSSARITLSAASTSDFPRSAFIRASLCVTTP
ncbi:hypothetical protein [Frateuria sp. Soil773]|uniref:hypothetical protein n=1 Tax=Frateuria sp. Soil773 TaxID=1736407 RepID=UPI0012FC03BD|nr:hypothetical protein [Frateuria sp. Soil773]